MKYFDRFFVLLVFVLILVTSLSRAQTKLQLSGRVCDEESGKPIAAVNVFITNTTLGAATDENGQFIIYNIPLGSYDLFVNHIGYELQVLPLELIERQKKPLEIKLKPRVLQGEKVVISARDLLDIERNRKTFRREFIGITRNAKNCRIENLESIEFYRDEDEALMTRSDSLLKITNLALGYRLEIYLESFRYEENDINYLIYPRFIELEPEDESQKKRWIKNRKETWEGSLRHFLATLARGEYADGLFRIYRGYLHPETLKIHSRGIPIKTRQPRFVQNEPIEELKRIQFNEFLIILYQDYTKMEGSGYHGQLGNFPTSYLQMKVPFATINIYGNFQPYNAFKVYGAWASARIADMLPLDYDPEDDDL